jgi:hypothetical protein
LGLARGTERQTGKRDDPVRVLAVAVQEVIVPLPAKPGVFPGETADNAVVDAITIHGLKEAFEAGHPGFWASVNQPKTFVTTAECWPVLSDLFREKMSVGVNDHTKTFFRLKDDQEWVEDLGELWYFLFITIPA